MAPVDCSPAGTIQVPGTILLLSAGQIVFVLQAAAACIGSRLRLAYLELWMAEVEAEVASGAISDDPDFCLPVRTDTWVTAEEAVPILAARDSFPEFFWKKGDERWRLSK